MLSWKRIYTLYFYLYMIIDDSKANKLPLAPYNVKLYCRSGRSFNTRSINPILCPTASTSCGYFEFIAHEKETIGVYECVDSSILLDEDEGREEESERTFKSLCDHRSRCHTLHLNRLNKQFFIRSHGIRLETLTSDSFKFCCSINHGNLKRLIISGIKELPFPTTLPVTCPQTKACDPGAVGCLYFENYEVNENEYVDVKPVELTWDEEDGISSETIPAHSSKDFYDSEEDSTSEDKGYRCVYKHLNDEIFRYCSMLHAKRHIDRCYYGSGHKICCCYVGPEQYTCDPKNQTIYSSTKLFTKPTNNTLVTLMSATKPNDANTTIKSITTTLLPTSTKPPFLYTTSFKKPTISIAQKTRCRTVTIHETHFASKPNRRPKSRKEINCDNVTDSVKANFSMRFSLLIPWVLVYCVLLRL